MDWGGLLNSTNDLVAQDFHFPTVDRNIQQLQSYADTLRARTNQSLDNQIAATRLLAQQGFDATRLTHDVNTLEIQPTIEDVFHAESSTGSVEEYLRQVEEATILAAIQDAQAETVLSFENFMEDCMSRDWAGNKKQLFGLIAPHSGSVSQTLAPASNNSSGAAGLNIPAKEQAYVNVLRRANQAAVMDQSIDLINEFTVACKGNEDRSHETVMSSCWALLGDVLSEIRGSGPNIVEGMLRGARKNLERGHSLHTRNILLRHKQQAERGADLEQLREVQAYILVKYGSKGSLDFQQAGGHDTSWLQVYFCLRNGWVEAARKAADRVVDPVHRITPPGGFASSSISSSFADGTGTTPNSSSSFPSILDDWLRGRGSLPDRQCASLVKECEQLLKDKAALKSNLRYPFKALVCALLAGCSRSVDALTATLSSLSVPSVLSTIEDFMWAKLTLVSTGLASGETGSRGGVPPLSMFAATPSTIVAPYSISDMQADLGKWGSSYYSKQGKEPLLYVTVLLLSLQLHAALHFLWKDDTTRAYRVDAVHMAIAMHQDGALSSLVPEGLTGSADDSFQGVDVGGMIQSYGRKFVHADSATALQYYMLASMVRGNSIAVKGQMLRELLTESRDFGTLLGGGGAAGSAAPLAAYVPDLEERKRLFEAVAYECQVSAQPQEAIELYMAADRPRQALSILNHLLSSDIGAIDSAGVSGAEPIERIITRGRDACTKIGSSPDIGNRKEVETFSHLVSIWELIISVKSGRHDLALQKLQELNFLPLEKARVEACARQAQQLHVLVLDRMQDVLVAAADVIAAQKAGASRDKLFNLKRQQEVLCQYANSLPGYPGRISKDVYQRLVS